MPTPELTRQIAELAVSYSFDTLPGDVLETAKLSILDNLGCAIRGSREELVQLLGEELFGRAIEAEELLPGALREGMPQARAMLHAAAGHAIDFDDTFRPAKSAHAGSAVVGSLLALLPHTKASGEELISALVAGYEVGARVGELLHPNHYLNGFHPTCTVGVFAAAAASAKLLQLDATQTAMALGLAATQASGLKCTFGTMAKPFNAANAAWSGVLAARLAARGYTAPSNALEAEKGYLELFLGLPASDWSIDGRDVFRIRQNMFKAYAACHATHGLIQGVEGMMHDYQFGAEDVDSVELHIADLAIKTASVVAPKSGLECKFSFNQVVASVLCGLDMAADATYSDEVLQNQAVNAMREKVAVKINPEYTTAQVAADIALKSGERHSRYFDYTERANNPVRDDEAMETKFLANCRWALGEARSEQLMSAIRRIDASPDALAALHV